MEGVGVLPSCGNQVRYIVGVIWHGKEETEKLCKGVNVCEGGLFFERFCTEDPYERMTDEYMAAIAGRFEIVPENARYIAMYPAYMMVRCPSNDVTVPNIKNQPWWPGRLFPCKSSIARGLRHLSDVPQLRQGVAPPLMKACSTSRTPP